MCGIAGVFTLAGPPTADDAAAVLRMLDAQVHRGPDDWGVLLPDRLLGAAGLPPRLHAKADPRIRTYESGGSGVGAVLGTRRLAILDLSPRGGMPMGSDDGRSWIAYNGETYNYRELRAELVPLGGPFRSESDTEAVLRGCQAWGERAVPRLRGMFAFALFESRPEPRLLLARDRFGIKPLYYYRDRDRLVFASEVRALLRSGLVPDEPNPDAVVRFLQLGSVPAPHTTIRDVLALPAGCALRVDRAGGEVRPYWTLSAHLGREPRATRTETVATTRALLEDSVRRHLVSDVPLGIFLSGGIDSSALVALAARLRERPVTTLSVAFDEPAWSEERYARLVAARYRTDHREIVLRSRQVFDGLPEVFAAMDEPSVDGVNAYFVSRAAREAGLTVVLSGTGGDEVFLGYPHFRRIRSLAGLRTALALAPAGLRRGLLALATRAGARRPGIDRLGYLERPTLERVYLLARGLFGPRQVADLLGAGARELEPLVAVGSETAARPLLDGFTALEFGHYLQNQLLKDTDVMSMAHSVEARVPFLDHPLVEFAVGLPTALRLDHRRPKSLLLDALGGDLPREVWDRPKMGFTLPFEPWLRQRAGELEAVCLEHTLFRSAAVEQVWREFRAGRLHWSRPWALVVLGQHAASRKRGMPCAS
ncbi:MAG TPA: asparagine synthase (glutamine-hydrolyzing) [Methylomirabilota bacterium]|nr:asparagine synthase (glutamine-hydrolyzing) [Methylomirabilota bacterium]